MPDNEDLSWPTIVRVAASHPFVSHCVFIQSSIVYDKRKAERKEHNARQKASQSVGRGKWGAWEVHVQTEYGITEASVQHTNMAST